MCHLYRVAAPTIVTLRNGVKGAVVYPMSATTNQSVWQNIHAKLIKVHHLCFTYNI